ncbi:hypothetical protein GCM10022255_115890 [Dactylosporangium darangshiense]|uniref:Uncharacterized protein n=1 Tax=Dactylosporangium darangshiense TaxID=579108 RepID=A0ABP8DW17_9ACTN
MVHEDGASGSTVALSVGKIAADVDLTQHGAGESMHKRGEESPVSRGELDPLAVQLLVQV